MSTYHTPEDLGPDQDDRDAAIPGRRFFVYVLKTDNGHYVGHTARLRARIREHRNGEVDSTAGSGPRLAWRSGPFYERHDAASFEAALKSMRDSGAPRFTEITGLRPTRFDRTYTARADGGIEFNMPQVPIRRKVAIGAMMGAVVGLLWAFNFEVGALGVGAIKVALLTGAFAIGLPILIWLAPWLAMILLSLGRSRRR